MVAKVRIIPSSIIKGGSIDNGSWICSCFAMPADAIDSIDLDRRIHSPTDYMVGDSTLGGSVCLNSPPGWTRTCDIPAGFGMNGTPETGYGTFQGESQIQNLDLVHLRAGIPEYNSLMNFYDRLFDPDTSRLANEGKIGVLSSIINLAVQTGGMLLSVPLAPFIIAGRFISWISDKPYSAYSYLRPTMDLFWIAFNTAANALAINMGLGIQSEMKRWDSTSGQAVDAAGLDESAMSAIEDLLPDIYKKNGTIDIFAASTRHKRLQNAYARYLSDKAGEVSSYDELMATLASTSRKVLTYPNGGFTSIIGMMSSYSDTTIANGKEDEVSTTDPTANVVPQTSGLDSGIKVGNQADKEVLEYYESDYAAHAKAMAVSGGDFLTLAVDYVKEVSVGISNTTGESSVSSKINSIVSSARAGKFATMHGNLGDGIISSGLEGILSIGKDIGTAAASAAGLNILTAMQGNGFVDINNDWTGSETNMPTLEYSFALEAPSAHPLAKFQMMLPILALLCLTSPRSTGTKSYTSPFFLEVSHKGRNHVPMGVISSLQIQFGEDRDDEEMPLSARVTFSIESLSNKLHVPISADTSNFFDEDSNFNDLLKIMGAVSLHDRDSVSASLKRRMSSWRVSFDQWTSSSAWANRTIGSLNSGFVGLLLPVTKRN